MTASISDIGSSSETGPEGPLFENAPGAGGNGTAPGRWPG